MRILMILLPGGGTRPRLKIGQVIEAYYLFRDGGAEVVLASVAGGAPISTAAGQDRSAAVLRLRRDALAREAIADTLSLDQVSAADFEAAFCIGAAEQVGAGADHPAGGLIAQLLDAGKPVAMLSDRGGVRLLITGEAPGPAAEALLGAVRWLRAIASAAPR